MEPIDHDRWCFDQDFDGDYAAVEPAAAELRRARTVGDAIYTWSTWYAITGTA